MAGLLSEEAFIKASLKGIVTAQKEYEAISGGEWLWCAPEYFSTVCVAQAIAKTSSSKYVTLESGVKATMSDAGRGRGRLHAAIRENGRFDLLLWWATEETPRAPIEIKIQVESFSHIKADAERIDKAVNRNGKNSSIRFGAIVFYSSCQPSKTLTAKERLTKYLENIEKDACSHLGSSCTISLHQSPIKEVEEDAWVAAVLFFKPKA